MTELVLSEEAQKKQAVRSFKESTASSHVVRDPGVWGLHKPEEYLGLYGKAPTFTKGDPLGKIFMDGRNKHSEPLVERSPRLILPGLSSFNPNVLRFQRELAKELDAALPVSLDDELFTPTGVHASFKNILGVAGYMQTPMSAKVIDTTFFRESLGLLPGYTARQKQIATMLWRLVWARARPAKVKVPKHSAGGMRRMSYDVQWKLDYALWKTSAPNYDRFLGMVESSDVYGLANDYEIVYGMYTQKRLQLDSINKVRYANDFEYALSGGRKGKREPTDKKVVIDGTEWEDFSALRVRVIDAGPWAINCDLQMVASSHMRALFQQFPSVFHVNTEEEIKAVVDGKLVYCSDVSEYDQSMSRDAIAVVFETMREFYAEGICRSAERLYQAPYFARPLSLEGKRGVWIKDPMDWDFEMNSGNRSGHAFTSLVAKVNKVAESLAIFDILYPVNETSIVAYLKGNMPIGLINNGDDEVIWTDAESDMRRFRALRGDLHVGHYVVAPEVGQGYSGLLLVRKNRDERIYHPSPRLQTPFEKCYVPERSVGTILRPYWPVGWFDRINSLHQTDAGREAWKIHNFVYAKHLENEIGPLIGVLERGLRSLPLIANDLTPIERAVLADSDKLHHKYDDEDVRDSVLALVTSNVPLEYVERWLRRYYTGVII